MKVNQVVPADELMHEARRLAHELAANDTVAVSLTRQALRRTLDVSGLRDALRQALDADIEVETTVTPESAAFNRVLEAEGVRAALAWRQSGLENGD